MKGMVSHVHLAEEETEANMLLKVTELARMPKLGPMSPDSQVHCLFSPTEVPPLHNLWPFRDWEREGKCYQSPLKARTARGGWGVDPVWWLCYCQKPSPKQGSARKNYFNFYLPPSSTRASHRPNSPGSSGQAGWMHVKWLACLPTGRTEMDLGFLFVCFNFSSQLFVWIWD